MPHIVIEHAKGLEHSHDLQALCDQIWTNLCKHPAIHGPRTVRVRTIAATASRIGTENQDFAHATLFLLDGRTDETKQELGQIILDALIAHFPHAGSLSVRIDRLADPYLKRML